MEVLNVCVCVCFQWLTSNSSLQDEPAAMDFVTAAANLRMHIFSMNMKSLFDVKCKSPADAVGLCVFVAPWPPHSGTNPCVSVPAMAGNIIPAIATTNAVIAGLIVLESLKILSGQIESCRTVRSCFPQASTPPPPLSPPQFLNFYSFRVGF